MSTKKAFVIGGGPLALGLSTKLVENGYSVIIIEATDRLLGLARTFKYKNIDVEDFYHFFYKNDHYNSLRWLQKFSKKKPSIFWNEISTDSVVSGSRYNLDSIISIFKLSGLKAIKIFFSLFKLMLFKPSEILDSIPAEIWAKNTFGDSFANQIWIPLLKQKFGIRSKEVSALWLATRIKRHMSTRGKGFGKSKFGYLVDTYTPFVEKFQKFLLSSGGQIFLNEPVEKLLVDGKKISKIKTKTKEFDVASFPVFSTVPYAILKDFFNKKKYINGLESFVNMGVIVCLLISDKIFSNHYWTTVSDENFEFAAIIQQNRLFKKSDNEIIYLSRYCDPNDKLFSMPDNLIYEKWIKSVTQIYPHITNENIVDFKIIKSKNAAPLPFINSKNQLAEINSTITNFYFSGYESIYPEDRGVGNSIKLGNELYNKFKLNLK